jgi:hypothetical protein
VYFILH